MGDQYPEYPTPLTLPQQGFTREIKTLSLNLRVPIKDLDSALRDFRNIGYETSFSQSNYDVAQESKSLKAQIDQVQTSIVALKKLVASSTQVADLLAAESALSERELLLTSLLNQEEALETQIQMSSISLTFTEFSSPAIGASFQESFLRGNQLFFDGVQASVTALGFAVPGLLAGALLSVLILLICFGTVRFVAKKTSSRDWGTQ